ncbi:MarR family winged helix-turn-helix transcriptional regulator [Deinococcus apachensis]|uniref:MarR family winged helix-turn-helix transcriptional regulator n=1 Tax=Deinococcus apachensis TaxID=309886 RepID=UPI0003A792FE|nr:MarR family winged helix-turn-helix transcriptional regulator [Deinococcus apachensis]
MTQTVPPPPELRQEVDRFLRGMWRFNRMLGQQLAPLLEERHGINPRMYHVLRSIQKGDHYPKVLADHLKIPTTLISRYLDGLSKAGLIERQIDEQDSRRTRLSLTGRGEQVVRETDETLHELVSGQLARLDPQVLQGLLTALDALTGEGEQA